MKISNITNFQKDFPTLRAQANRHTEEKPHTNDDAIEVNVERTPEHTSRVQELKLQVDSGNYDIDTHKVADKFLREILAVA